MYYASAGMYQNTTKLAITAFKSHNICPLDETLNIPFRPMYFTHFTAQRYASAALAMVLCLSASVTSRCSIETV